MVYYNIIKTPIQERSYKMETRFTVRLKDEDYSKIKKIAEMNSRSVNKQLEFIIKNTIKDYEKILGEIKLESESSPITK